MSRKTLDEYPDLLNIWPPPKTSHPQNADTRASKLPLNGGTVTRAYKEPWKTHLTDATPDFTDALWGINEAKRDTRESEE